MNNIVKADKALKSIIENIVMASCKKGGEPFCFSIILLYLKFRWWLFCRLVNYRVRTPDALNILLAKLKAGDDFVDIGANVGWVTSAAGFVISPLSKIYAFEPSPSVFKLLKNRVKLLRLKNVYIYNFALGSVDSRGILHEFDENFGGASSLMSDAWMGHKHTRVSDVILKHLDSFFKKESIKNIGLMKIDVQGAELDVLRGAATLLQGSCPPILYIEIEKDSLRAFHYTRKDLMNLISQLGYEMYCWRNFKLVNIKSVKDLSDGGHDDVVCFKGSSHEEMKSFMKMLSV